jgi:hypothetical protein
MVKENPKDKVKNAERKRLVEWIEEDGWEVLKGKPIRERRKGMDLYR